MNKAHRKLSFKYAKTSVAEIVTDIRLAYCKILGSHKNMIVSNILNEYFKSFRLCNFVTLSEQN